MTVKVAINGFGRIGRNILRAIVESGRSDIQVVAINDLGPVETNAHLLRFDSVHGRFPSEVTVDGDNIVVDGQRIRVTAIKNPAELPHKELGVDIALECTGIFTAKDKASAHLQAGAKRVIVSAPADGADLTVVYGVNHDKLTRDHMVVSNASCTTNALAPVAKVLHDAVGIEKGFMTTIHSYTNDQPSLDQMHKDLYRARAAALSMIPTSTGAGAGAQGRSRLHGPAQRVDRLQPRSALLHLPHGPDQGDGRHARAGHVLVRQRVGLLEPHGGHRRRHGEADLTGRRA
jgi:glyceraldehyde 3-phosphate dehydrogenase